MLTLTRTFPALVVVLIALVSSSTQSRSQEKGTAPTEQDAPAPEKPAVDPLLAEKLASPAKTLETFITAVNDGLLDEAAECLDLSGARLTEDARQAKGPEYAYKLKELIDRMARVNYHEIRDIGSEEEQLWRLSYDVRGMDDDDIGDAALIMIAPGSDGLWRFTTETVAAIDELYERWNERPKKLLTTVSKAEKPFTVWLSEQFPASQHEPHFLIPDYQWVCLLLVIFVGLLADMTTRGILNAATRVWWRYRGEGELPERRKMWKPVGLFVQALTWYGGTLLIGLPAFALTVLLVGLKFFAVVAAVWTVFHLIDLLAAVAAKKAGMTDTRFDDLLVPLISKSLKVLAVCIGLLQCAQAFDLPIAGLLGGLGIGGMALAFASQDAVSNLFGSVTVLMDRPFEVGDWVIAENVEGSVETVGFRSTRIRTFHNSLITLPNSRLTTAIVDNMGRRQYRRIKTMLSVQYDTSPEQIDAFCEGIRELIRRHPYTRKDYYHVYLNQFSGSSLDILLYCFVDCPDWSIELRERHRLFVDILRLADSLGVSFAFPTRTLHMIQQEPGSPPDIVCSDPPGAGRASANRIMETRPREKLGPVAFGFPPPAEDKYGDPDGDP